MEFSVREVVKEFAEYWEHVVEEGVLVGVGVFAVELAQVHAGEGD